MNLEQWQWLGQVLSALPLALWVYLGIGGVWALALLPRRMWQERALWAASAIALGAGLMSALLFVLGTLGGASQTPLMRFDLSFGLSVLVFGLGAGLAWRKRRLPYSPQAPVRLRLDEKLIVLALGLALVLRWFVTSYWVFSAYDTLWVYGYQGRLFNLHGFIPPELGYYPPFLSLQYALMQMPFGVFDDHYARVVIMFLHLGAILAAYALGKRLFNVRTGILLAGAWGLFWQVGEWAMAGDLEIPLAFLFTLSATFFLSAWFAEQDHDRRANGLLAGVMLGIALWTKPTAGAYVWGVMLLVVLDFILKRGDWRAWLPRFRVAFWTGLACIPMGGMWYVRNILLGHAPVDFPHPNWLTLALRSAELFGWLWLALSLAGAFMLTQKRVWLTDSPRQLCNPDRLLFLLAGLGLLAGILPSLTFLFPERTNPPESYLRLPELLSLAVGLVSAALLLIRQWGFEVPVRHAGARLAAAAGLAIPYLLTWFFSYSYHYRLLFAVTPLLILPVAALLADWRLPAQPVLRRAWRVALSAAGALYAFIGIFISWTSADSAGLDWLWTNKYPTDTSRYYVHNASQIWVTEYLEGYQRDTGRAPSILAPGEQHLSFFHPEWTIVNEGTPTRLDDLAPFSHFVYGTLARWRYEDAGIAETDNQIVAALGRRDVFTPILKHDSTFRYELYQVDALSRLQDPPVPVAHMLEDEVIFGDVLRYLGDEVSNANFNGNAVFTMVLWQVLQTPEADYTLVFDLQNKADGVVYYEWSAPIAPHEHGSYHARLWQAGEFIRDMRRLVVESSIPSGAYHFRLSVYRTDDPEKKRLPITINGVRDERGYWYLAGDNRY